LKGSHFQSVSEVKLKTVDLLNRVSADDLQHCFEQWKIHVQWCIDRGKSMLKEIEINLEDFENKLDFSHVLLFNTCTSYLLHFEALSSK
jgi:hypothetical protein